MIYLKLIIALLGMITMLNVLMVSRISGRIIYLEKCLDVLSDNVDGILKIIKRR